MIQIIILVLIFCHFAIAMLFIFFPKYIKARIEKKKNYEIRLYGIIIIFIAIMFYLSLSIISTSSSILRELEKWWTI